MFFDGFSMVSRGRGGKEGRQGLHARRTNFLFFGEGSGGGAKMWHGGEGDEAVIFMRMRLCGIVVGAWKSMPQLLEVHFIPLDITQAPIEDDVPTLPQSLHSVTLNRAEWCTMEPDVRTLTKPSKPQKT